MKTVDEELFIDLLNSTADTADYIIGNWQFLNDNQKIRYFRVLENIVKELGKVSK